MTDDLTRARMLLRVGGAITLLALLGAAGVYCLALNYTPTEASQGLAQKIFYIHRARLVPAPTP